MPMPSAPLILPNSRFVPFVSSTVSTPASDTETFDMPTPSLPSVPLAPSLPSRPSCPTQPTI